jgi:hypothetical protein
MKKVQMTLYVVFSLVLLLLVRSVHFAQIVPRWVNEQNSLTILDAKCVGTSTSLSGLSCRVRNDSSKDIVAFTVLWTITSASGTTSRSSMMEDKSLVKSLKRISPGDAEDCVSEGSVSTPPVDPITNVDVGIDYILFADGSTSGKDQTHSGSMIWNRQLAANSLRTLLLKIYQEKGLEALLEELKH